MQQQSFISASTSSSPQIISARTLFSVRPTGPPSSPPPTSPLPPLPEIAPSSQHNGVNLCRRAPNIGPPVRPPRPQTSLPDLQPRTIKSPEIARRQRHSELAAQVKASPIPRQTRTKCAPRQHAASRSEHRQSMRLLTPIPKPVSSFSEDVISALPRLFRDTTLKRLDTSFTALQNSDSEERQRAWQEYHRSPCKTSSTSKRQKMETKRSVARSALFVHKPPSFENTLSSPPNLSPAHSLDQSCRPPRNQRQTQQASPSPTQRPSANTPRASSTTNAQQLSYKKSRATNTLTFDFKHYYDSSTSTTHDSADDTLTSLPKCPSPPRISPASLTHPRPHQIRKSTHATLKTAAPSEAITFFSLPYAHTLQSAGPRPKTEQDPLSPTPTDTPPSQAALRQSDPERGATEDEPREMTEEEKRVARRKRVLWTLATVSLVILATVGIVGGIIGKLTSIGG